MKNKLLLIFIFFTLLSCKKSELSITPAVEKKLCQTAYYLNSEVIDGYNVKTYLDSNIQKTAEGALKKGLISNNADYGCVVIMETNSGKVKAMVNLNKELDGGFKYKTTTAICQVNEPGGLMRTFDLLALLEDKKADTTSVFDTHGGEFTFLGKKIRDSCVMNGKISLAKAFKVSSSTVFAQAINNSYSSNPSLFCNRFKNLGFNKSLGLPFENEGLANFTEPNTNQWSAISLPWLSMGYGLSITPVQLLTYYNAIANNGVIVKPLFLSEIKDKAENIKTYTTEVINPKIASEKTVSILQHLLTKKAEIEVGAFLKSNKVKIAGNSAVVTFGYANSNTKEKKYLASFVGYFPVNKPKYSFVCIIYNPQKNQSLYRSVECGGVIKEIVEKVN